MAAGHPTLTEIAQHTGLHKATTHHILKTLEELGYVQRDAQKRYAIGPHLVRLAETRIRSHTVKHAAEDAALWLSDRLRETVHIAVLHRGERFVVARVESNQTVTIHGDQVEHRELYGGCSGPVLLAHLDPSELDEIVRKHGLPGATWQGITTLEGLQEALREVTEMSIFGRLTPDRQAQLLAVPVYGPDGRVWASISVSLPVSRYEGHHKEQVLRGMHEAAERMSAALSLAYEGVPDRAPTT